MVQNSRNKNTTRSSLEGEEGSNTAYSARSRRRQRVSGITRLTVMRKRIHQLQCRRQRYYNNDDDADDVVVINKDDCLSLLSLDDLALGKITSFLDVHSVYNLQLTCRRFYSIASNAHNWGKFVLSSCLIHHLRTVLCRSESDQEINSLHVLITKAKDLKVKLSTMTLNNVIALRSLHGPVVTEYLFLTTHCWQRTEFDPVCITIQLHNKLTIQFNYPIGMNKAYLNKELVEVFIVNDGGSCNYNPVTLTEKTVMELLRNEVQTKPELTWDALMDILETIICFWQSNIEHSLLINGERLTPSIEKGPNFEKDNKWKIFTKNEIRKETREIREKSLETFTKTVLLERNGRQTKVETNKFIDFLLRFLRELTVKHLRQLETMVINFESTLNSICRLQPIVRICSHPLLKANLRAAVELILRPMALKFAVSIKEDFWLTDNADANVNQRLVTLELFSKQVLSVTGYPEKDDNFMVFSLPTGESISLSSAEITSCDRDDFKKLKPVTKLLNLHLKRDFKRLNLPKISDLFVAYFFITTLNMRQKGVSPHYLNNAVDKFLRLFQKQELPRMGDAKKYRFT